MRPTRRISRRSFLARIGGASALALAGCTYEGVIDERPPGSPRREPLPGRREHETCTDGDSGRHVDPPGHGRGCSSTRRRRRRPNDG